MTNDIDIEYDGGFTQTDAFRAYRERIEQRFARKAGQLVTVAEIHRGLGKAANGRWTLLALQLSTRFAEEPFTPRLGFRVIEPEVKDRRKWNGGMFNGRKVGAEVTV